MKKVRLYVILLILGPCLFSCYDNDKAMEDFMDTIDYYDTQKANFLVSSDDDEIEEALFVKPLQNDSINNSDIEKQIKTPLVLVKN